MRNNLLVLLICLAVGFAAGWFAKTASFGRMIASSLHDTTATVETFAKPSVEVTGVAAVVEGDDVGEVPETEIADALTAKDTTISAGFDSNRVARDPIQPLEPKTFLLVRHWPSGGWDSVKINQLGAYRWTHKEADSTATTKTVTVMIKKQDFVGELAKYTLAGLVVYATLKSAMKIFN